MLNIYRFEEVLDTSFLAGQFTIISARQNVKDKSTFIILRHGGREQELLIWKNAVAVIRNGQHEGYKLS